MSLTELKRANALCGRALDLEPVQREVFLTDLAGSDPALARQVRSLLIAMDQVRAQAFLPTDQNPMFTFEQEVDPESRLGERIGPFRLVRVLGVGGMGSVYLAEQREPIQREVALKLVRMTGDAGRLFQRFENERQLLAYLDHRHITQVYDFGSTEQGESYFAMEYAPGLPITEHCDGRRLSLEARLELFVQICEAVHHAHQKGIIHRDIKPGNVLVKLEDGVPVPKIIDFGIARVTREVPGIAPNETHATMILGTPAYMSPEQASGLPDIDTRTDIYGLGALLYHLLVGVAPLDEIRLRGLPLVERLALIQTGAIARPSARLRGGGEAEGRQAVARGLSVKGLIGRLRGDLDRIVMKALAKDRRQRYGAVSELAADIQRFLNHEPVTAMPPSTWYRLERFVQRHRRGVLVTLFSSVLLLCGLVVTLRAYSRAKDAEAAADRSKVEAQLATERVQTTLSVVSDMVTTLNVFTKDREVNVTDLLKVMSAELEGGGADQEAVALTHHGIGETYARLSHYEEAESELRKAHAIRRKVLGDDHVDTLTTAILLGWVLLERGRFEEGGTYIKAAHTRAANQLGDDHPLTIKGLIYQGKIEIERRNFSEARRFFLEALPLCMKRYGERHADTVTALDGVGQADVSIGAFENAAPFLEQAVQLAPEVFGQKHPETLNVMHDHLAVLLQSGLLDEAEARARLLTELREEVQGPNNHYTLASLSMWGSILLRQLNYSEAEGVFRTLHERGKTVFGEEHPRFAHCLNYLGRCLYMMGKVEEAAGCFERALGIERKTYGDRHMKVATSHFNLGSALLHLSPVSEKAQHHLETAQSIYREQQAPGPTVLTLLSLRQFYELAGNELLAAGLKEEAAVLAAQGMELKPAPQMAVSLALNAEFQHLAEDERDR